MSPRPNRHALALAGIVLAMWYAGEAQKNGGAYILAFLTGTIALVSWLHAKANLRALRLEAGAVPPATQGGSMGLPLILTAGDGRLPCGLEITAEHALEPVFVDTLAAGHPLTITLRVPSGDAGLHRTRRVLVRSRYPLGFFTAQRVFDLPSPGLVHPRPAGRLPMPQVDVSHAAMTSAQSAAAQHGSPGAGEDFAGIREWQPGDSLRQVDWKAVARGRPLMVKLWTGETKGVVWLDWAACPLPEHERAAQFAAWMEQAETLGLSYGLRLPALTIQPGKGLAHHRRCLDELALLQPESVVKPQHAKEMQAVQPPTLEFSTRIPGSPTRLFTFGMALAAVPMIGSVPVAGLLAYYLALILHWYQRRKQRAPVSQGWRLLLVACGTLGTWLQGGTLYGLEPGVSLMLVVTGAKLLESRSAHDLQISALLGWFLCLCDLAVDQALGRSLYVLAVFALLTTALVRMRHGRSGFKIPARMTGALLAQSVPLVLMLFLFFPRGSGGLAMHIARQFSHRTGISSTLDPGSVAEIAQSQGRAFWVSFPEGNVPDISDRYWRCMVMWNCDGLKWKRGRLLPDPMPDRKAPFEKEVRQVITLDPHGGTWLPALDMPVHVMSNVNEHSITGSDGILTSATQVDSVRRYEVGSRKPSGTPPDLPFAIREAATRVPANLSPAVKALADSFKKDGGTDFQMANAALNYFRTQGFRYTLEPDKYGASPLDEFLFQRKLGFCEHFAASFATLMRQCGVPARLVIGYLGGEYSERWGHYIVRQEDAHAWCELWYAGRGWTRVDPTAALAPGRIGTDLRTYLEGGLESAFARNRNTWWGRAFTETQLFWDNINYQWYTRVVQFDEDDQTGLVNSWRLLRYGWRLLLLGGVLVFVLPLALLWFWLRHTPRPADPAVRAWQAFCRKLAKAGVSRTNNEPPATFTTRAAAALPQSAQDIQRIGDLYVQLRYAGDDSVITDLKRRVGRLRVGRS